MAQAPTPGQVRFQQGAAQARMTMTVKMGEGQWTFAPLNLPFALDAEVRKMFDGKPFEWWLDESRMGISSLKVIVYVARRANGEDVTMEQIDAEWDIDTFDIDTHDPDDKLPEDADPNG